VRSYERWPTLVSGLGGIDGEGKRILTANGPAGDVSVMDTATVEVQRGVGLGDSAWGDPPSRLVHRFRKPEPARSACVGRQDFSGRCKVARRRRVQLS
jgi:YVTN family beta-propeller protein